MNAVSLAAVPAYRAIKSTTSTKFVSPKERHRVLVGVGTQVVSAEDFTTRLNDRRLPVAEPAQRSAMPDDVDNLRVEADGDRFHFM